jgi:hypothetical protein
VSDNPYDSPQAPTISPFSKESSALDWASIAPLCDVSGWLKFLGIMNIIVGVIYCITIIGAVVGWLPLWIGILLNNAGNSLQSGYQRRSEPEINVGMSKLALTIKIIGILTVIALAINVLYLVFILVAVVGGIAAGVSS